jgi:trans-AT polyketide synthase/acyltransferase/oxidoreductase domain-containing protein
MTALTPLGSFTPGASAPAFEAHDLARIAREVRAPVHVVHDPSGRRVGAAIGGQPQPAKGTNGASDGHLAWLATLPALYPEWLGDRHFCETHQLRFPYVAGAMANGIATTALVESMANGGMLAFFGAAGLPIERVERAVVALSEALDPRERSWGSNLIHSPQDPAAEDAAVDLYLRHGVQRVSASAFMELTPAVVRYASSGLTERPDGSVARRNHVFAKISRPEVARAFMRPAPPELLDPMVRAGALHADEARLAARVPVAGDVTVEADSGGHTDNRPLTALFPIILRLRAKLEAEHGYTTPIRVGAAGGLGTPSAVATAFGLGAAYVLTGSVNQAAVESGLADEGKAMLADVSVADVMMAPAADMFEMGVKVQVLRRGSLFGPRASRLYRLYGLYDGLDAMPAEELEKLEREILQKPVAEVWDQTRRYFAAHAPEQLTRAEADPKHRMALVFRWYLGLSSHWAIAGDAARRMDYQIWCGPAMGAFNDWVRGSFLEPPAAREVLQIALNLLEGAAVVTRAQQLRSYGVPIAADSFSFQPRRITP